MGGFFNAVTVPTGGDPNHVRKSRVPEGMCYLPHDGRQAKLRRMRQRTRHLEVSVEQDFRINVWMKSQAWKQDVSSQLVRVYILHAALCESEETGVPFSDVLDCHLDTIEREQSIAIEQQLAGGGR